MSLPRQLASALALYGLLLGCATPAPPLSFSAAYTTHFEGIPDEAGVCALLSNDTDEAIDWTALRMQAYSDLGEQPGRWRSRWMYRGRIEPGETVAVELVDPPPASRIELRIIERGRALPRRTGRPVIEADNCSDAWLAESLRERVAGRDAPDIEVVQTASPDETLIAEAPE